MEKIERCLCGRQIKKLCNNEECLHPAQFCDSDCFASLNHERCSSIRFSYYNNLEKKIQETQMEFVRKVNLILSQLAEEIKINLNQKIQRKYCQKLGKMIKKLRKDKRFRERRALSGKQVKEAYEEMKDINNVGALFENGFNQFSETMQGFRNAILQERQRFIGSVERIQQEQIVVQEEIRQNTEILEQNNQDMVVSDSPSQDLHGPLNVIDRPRQQKGPVNLKKFKPEILIPDLLTESSKKFVINSFRNKKVKDIIKVFSASARENVYQWDKFNVSQLFSKCGHLRNTLAVVQFYNPTHKETYLFGGFTPLQWGQGQKFQNDPTNLSRLFLFNQKMIFPIKIQQGEPNQAIYIDRTYGLIFGNDLYIKSKGIKRKAVNIGSQYSISHLTTEEREILSSYQTKIEGNGKVKDYQIYQIVFEEDESLE